jgi:hypothetical protein
MDENPAKKVQVQDEGVQLTPNILITFAMIIQAFARLEWLIQMSMAGIIVLDSLSKGQS